VHLVGFIIRICHDAQSHERKKKLTGPFSFSTVSCIVTVFTMDKNIKEIIINDNYKFVCNFHYLQTHLFFSEALSCGSSS
jgi:hypothetical protein